MFCKLTYSCIQFIQRMVPPLSINCKTKPIRLSSLYKKSGRVSTTFYLLRHSIIFQIAISVILIKLIYKKLNNYRKLRSIYLCYFF